MIVCAIAMVINALPHFIALSLQHLSCVCVSISPGQQCQLGSVPSPGATRAGDGGYHGSVLPGVLVTVRCGGSPVHLRPP